MTTIGGRTQRLKISSVAREAHVTTRASHPPDHHVVRHYPSHYTSELETKAGASPRSIPR